MKKALVAILLVAIMAGYADAKLVKYQIVLPTATSWQVYAQVSESDSAGGLALYTFKLGGINTPATNWNMGPKTFFTETGDKVGFTDNRAVTGGKFVGAQDTVNAGEIGSGCVLAYGLGVTAGTLGSVESGAHSADVQFTYGMPLLLAQGTRPSGSTVTMLIGAGAGTAMVEGTRYAALPQNNTFANTFESTSDIQPDKADVMLIPEPATIGMLVLGLGLLRRRS
jgi:hypothetical protein